MQIIFCHKFYQPTDPNCSRSSQHVQTRVFKFQKSLYQTEAYFYLFNELKVKISILISAYSKNNYNLYCLYYINDPNNRATDINSRRQTLSILSMFKNDTATVRIYWVIIILNIITDICLSKFINRSSCSPLSWVNFK